MFSNKTILITGGTGSWGQELTRQLLEGWQPKEIRVYSRGELRQVEMRHAFRDPRLKYIIGDVADKDRLRQAAKGCQVIFHAAALKHVPICEENEVPAVMTNIMGTQNVIDIALEYDIETVVDISTDKAVDPINLYGTTKAVGEKLIVNANKKTDKTKFVCVRGGNVIGSSGSVIPLFRKQIQTMNKVTITDERMTRFIFSLKDAIGLIFKAVEKSVGGEIFVMKMPAARTVDVADVMIKELGDKSTKKEIIGIRPGEKLYEVLVSRYEAARVVDDDEYFIILPYVEIAQIKKRYGSSTLCVMEEFNSVNTRMLSMHEIKEIIRENGFLKKDTLVDELSKEVLEEIAAKKKWLI